MPGRRPAKSRCRAPAHHRAMTGLRRLVSGALDLALPAACSGCGREGRPLCDACLPALDSRLLLPGGTPIGLPADIPAPLLQLEWCAPYVGPVRGALHDLKYAGERRLADPLGAAVARRWRRVGVGADVVVPVPVHADRERRRGYDQAALDRDGRGRGPRAPLRPGARTPTLDGRAVRARTRRARVERRRGVRRRAGGCGGSADRRSLGPPRGRRRDDRRDAGCVRRGTRRRGRPGRVGDRRRAGTLIARRILDGRTDRDLRHGPTPKGEA